MTPYYSHAGIVIYHADCRDVLPQLEADAVDCTITDPPYSDYTATGARTHPNVGFDRGNSSYINFSITQGDLIAVLAECGRISRRWVIATVDWRHAALLSDNTPRGLRFVRFGIWVKPDGAPQFTGDRPAPGWEAIAILHRDSEKLAWNGGGARAVWTHHIVRACEVGHPTPKPLPLIREFVQQFSDGGPILDPFAGSGTTLLAARGLGRRAVGIEVSEAYCEIAAKRLSQEVLPLEAPAPKPEQGQLLDVDARAEIAAGDVKEVTE